MGDALGFTLLTRFLLLYAAMYAAFGVASPFFPAFLSTRGVAPAQLGLVLSVGTVVRLLTAPLAGRLGDTFQALRVVLVLCTGLAAVVTLAYLGAQGVWRVLGVSLLQAASLAPMTILADALALGAAAPSPHGNHPGFEYGWVRAAGSAAFVVGTLLSGQMVNAFGLNLIVGLQAALLGATALVALLVPELRHKSLDDVVRAAGWRTPASSAASVSAFASGGCSYPWQSCDA